MLNPNLAIKNLFHVQLANPIVFGNKVKRYLPAIIPPMDLLDTPYIGWELEAEGWSMQNAKNEFLFNEERTYILITDDGSLKDNGAELITRGPLQKKELYESLLEMQYIADNLVNGFSFSHRCSFHVHLNAQELTPIQLYAFITAYIVVEPLLFKLCEPHRQGNSYCIPLNILNITKKSLEQQEYAQTKYWALSLNRLMDLGTIEIRSHHGTSDIVKLQKWIKLLQHIYKFAEETKSLAELTQQLTKVTTNEEKNTLIQTILGTNEYNDLLSRLDLETNDSLFNSIFFLEN